MLRLGSGGRGRRRHRTNPWPTSEIQLQRGGLQEGMSAKFGGKGRYFECFQVDEPRLMGLVKSVISVGR